MAKKTKRAKAKKPTAPAWVNSLTAAQRAVLTSLRPVITDKGPCQRIVRAIAPGQWHVGPKSE